MRLLKLLLQRKETSKLYYIAHNLVIKRRGKDLSNLEKSKISKKGVSLTKNSFLQVCLIFNLPVLESIAADLC